jgi:hypothetical protein
VGKRAAWRRPPSDRERQHRLGAPLLGTHEATARAGPTTITANTGGGPRPSSGAWITAKVIPPNASEAGAEPRKSSLRLGPVHGRECRHVCRLRRARRGLLRSRRAPSGSDRLHADPAGAASLPITALILVLSPRALPTRIGPRLPLTLGPILIAVGMVMMRGIHAGDSYVGSVLPPTRRLRPRLVARGRPDHGHGPRRRRAGVASVLNTTPLPPRPGSRRSRRCR